MTKEEFRRLTNDMVQAHRDYMLFMDRFVREGPIMKPPMTRTDLDRAIELQKVSRHLEERWFDVARGTEPLTD